MTFRQQLTQEIIHVGFRSFWIWNLMRLITLFIRSLCHLAVIRDLVNIIDYRWSFRFSSFSQ